MTDYVKICDDFIATAGAYGVKENVIEQLVHEYMTKANPVDIEVLTEQIENEMYWSRERSFF